MLYIHEINHLKAQGKRLKRAGMSERVIALVQEFIAEGQTYKGAMKLAGALKAVTIAAQCDSYWKEQCQRGLTREIDDISKFTFEEKEELNDAN